MIGGNFDDLNLFYEKKINKYDLSVGRGKGICFIYVSYLFDMYNLGYLYVLVINFNFLIKWDWI